MDVAPGAQRRNLYESNGGEEMSLLVVGSMALDSVKTPFGEREGAVGGSATYFSISASFFTDVRLVGVVGADFPEEALSFLAERNVDLRGLERTEGKTFHWKNLKL